MIMEMNGKIAENNEKLKSISEYYYKDILNQYSSTVAPLKIGDCFHYFGKYSETMISSLDEFVTLPTPTIMREIWVLTGIEYEHVPDSSTFIAVLVFTNLVAGSTIRNEVVKEVMNTIAIDIKDKSLRDGSMKLLRINPNIGVQVHNQLSACIFNRLTDIVNIRTDELITVGSLMQVWNNIFNKFEVVDIMVGDMVPYYITTPSQEFLYNIEPGSAILKIRSTINGYTNYMTYTELLEKVRNKQIKILPKEG